MRFEIVLSGRRALPTSETTEKVTVGGLESRSQAEAFKAFANICRSVVPKDIKMANIIQQVDITGHAAEESIKRGVEAFNNLEEEVMEGIPKSLGSLIISSENI